MPYKVHAYVYTYKFHQSPNYLLIYALSHAVVSIALVCHKIYHIFYTHTHTPMPNQLNMHFYSTFKIQSKLP